jgi:Fic family protein
VNDPHNHRMKHGDYIWRLRDWPDWRYDLAALAGLLDKVSRAQGLLLGRLADVGFDLRNQACLAALTDDVLKTSEIEGERLSVESVRSSIARRLGVDIGALAPSDRYVEGVVAMILDATARCDAPLTRDRLFGWHAALFPTGYSEHVKVSIGRWRDDHAGPMQVVSGRMDRPTVHFEAPPASRLEKEMVQFLRWVEHDRRDTPLLKAGLAHLWFVTLHPFDDGNGRVGRAVGDLLLARADGSPERFYSLSAQIQRDRKGYYKSLEQTQRGGSLDVTPWLGWFLTSLDLAVTQANKSLDSVLLKARCWMRWGEIAMNARQKKVLNRVLDGGFEGKLTNRKWSALGKCSPDAALRDLNELVTAGVLRKSESGGRSTSYEVVANDTAEHKSADLTYEDEESLDDERDRSR